MPRDEPSEEKSMPFPSFSPWTPWPERTQGMGVDRPGVYLLARFDGSPALDVSPLDPSIVCIAETHDQTLTRRWNQFHYCAFQKGTGHSEGRAFSRIYCGGEEAEVPPWLFVSAAPIGWDESDIEERTRS